MPSPIGHALAGVAVAWTADVVDGQKSSSRFVAICAGLAMLPDTDLIIPALHRTATHSLAAAVVVFIIAAAVTGQVTRWRTATLCGLAYASHLLLDWLGADFFPPRGIQLLWPFSGRWFISDWDIFQQTARRGFLTAPIIKQNAVAVARELAILLPIVLLLWLVRVKTASRFPTELTRRHHPSQ